MSFRTLNTTRIAGECMKRALVTNNAIKCENSLTFFCTYKKYPNCHYLQHTMSIKLAFCMSIFFHFWSCLFLILPSFFHWYLCFPWCAVSTLFLRLPLWQTSQDFQLGYMWMGTTYIPQINELFSKMREFLDWMIRLNSIQKQSDWNHCTK